MPSENKKNRVEEVAEYNNYLLQRFNDYEVPLTMTAEDVRRFLIMFVDEYE